MSRRPRSRVAAAVLIACASAGCDREERSFSAPPPTMAVTRSDRATASWSDYDDNRWAIAEGQRLYSWFNCAGCHAPGGGGAIGPPLRDSIWIYGSDPDEIFTTIVEGRPGGMPAFGALIRGDDVRKLVAFVRSMAQLTPFDTRPARADAMSEANPQRREPEERR
jgi:cytochrome c oxidase cbb3-type subunit 3